MRNEITWSPQQTAFLDFVDIEAEIERTLRRISFMVLSDHDRERAEQYLIELYVQREIMRQAAKAGASIQESRP